MKGWHEAFDIPPIVVRGEEFVNARRFQSAEFHRRGSGGRFHLCVAHGTEYGLPRVALPYVANAVGGFRQGPEARDLIRAPGGEDRTPR